MSRLTRRAEADGVKAVWYGNREVFLEGETGYAEADKLAHYEDLEEAGRLIELPCKVGDMVYLVDDAKEEIHPFRIANIEISEYGKILLIVYAGNDRRFRYWRIRTSIKNFGTLFFSTKPEAEVRLAEIQKGE